jgi:uracil-DNA glycosylase
MDSSLRAWLISERRLGAGIVGVAAVPIAAAVERSSPPPPTAPAPRAPGPPLHRLPATAAEKPRPIAVGGELPPLVDQELSDTAAREALRVIDEGFVRGCSKCVLCQERTQTVFGVGRPRPEIVFVGEGPGADEDRAGEPFVGRAGQLLTRMIAAMTLTRDQVYICNTVKCRPPENRTPTEEEMAACSPYLYRQLAILRPRVIVTLGRPASQSLLASTIAIGKLRGQFHDFPPPPLAHLGLPKAKLMPTFHPAYLLRSPNEKGKAWEDLQQVMAYLGIPLPGRQGI